MCPYYGLWKVHILVLGVTNNRLTCMQGQKTLSLSYNMHLFLPYLLNDSQTIHSTIHFSKPLLYVTLICSDWSISFKAVFVSSVLLCVQRYQGNSYFNAPKWHLVAKNELAFSFRPTWKVTDGQCSQVCNNMILGGQYDNVSCWRQHETALDSF